MKKRTDYTRKNKDRRQRKSEGYIYLGMVGWYCRRGRVRRKDDSLSPSGNNSTYRNDQNDDQ